MWKISFHFQSKLAVGITLVVNELMDSVLCVLVLHHTACLVEDRLYLKTVLVERVVSLNFIFKAASEGITVVCTVIFSSATACRMKCPLFVYHVTCQLNWLAVCALSVLPFLVCTSLHSAACLNEPSEKRKTFERG